MNSPHIAVALWKGAGTPIKAEVRTYSGLTMRSYLRAISASWTPWKEASR